VRLFDLLRGLDLAWSSTRRCMNLSLVGPPNPLLERAANRLDDLGAIVVAAAGNEGVDEPRYPAAYPSVVGVGAVDAKGAAMRAATAGLGADLGARRRSALDGPGARSAFASGTSFAAAHVTGALAVLIGSGATPDAARRALFQTARGARRRRRASRRCAARSPSSGTPVRLRELRDGVIDSPVGARTADGARCGAPLRVSQRVWRSRSRSSPPCARRVQRRRGTAAAAVSRLGTMLAAAAARSTPTRTIRTRPSRATTPQARRRRSATRSRSAAT
jgi:subtilisin family serine protease